MTAGRTERAGGGLRALLPAVARRATRAAAGYLDAAQMRVFDRLLGVSTSERVFTPDSIFASGADNCPYQGCQWVSVHRALKALRPGPDDVFVDLGAGKGKALLIAGRLPFGQVIGVELDEALAEYSQCNIDRARPRLRSRSVQSVGADVLEWPVPDDASVIFLYNPFVGQTFRAALGRVFDSYDRCPRDLHVVYYFPWEHDWLMSTGRVAVDDVRPISWPASPGWWRTGSVIVTYRVTGGPADNGEAQRAVRGRRPLLRRSALDRWSAANQHRFAMSVPGQEPVYSQPQ